MCLADTWSWNPAQIIRNMRSDAFWDVAKPSSYIQSALPPHITWDDEFVGEVDRALRACQVFLFFPFLEFCKDLNAF